jgi:2-oxoisovalerate dehydrogenase E1 component beta subunit
MPVTYLEAIRQGLWEELERDPAVFCMGEDIGVYGGAFKVTEGMIDRFGPERIIDMPIAESAIVGAAFGAALLGMRPVAEFQFMDFIGCAFNQITNMIAKAHYRWGAPAPVVLRGPSGGGVHGGPFHSQNPEMHFVHTPGLKVVCPGTPTDAYGLIKSAIRDNNPVIFFEHKFLYRRLKEELPIADDFTVPLGKARIAREGKHVSVITYAAMLQVALEAASILATEAIELEILDLRTLMPLDRKAIADTVRKTNLAIILHEDTKTGGIAGEIAAIINEEAFDYLDGPIVRITSLDTPVPFSPPLEHEFLPSVRDVVEKARWLKRQAQPSLETPSRSSQRVVPAETEIHPGKIVPMSAARRQWAQAAVHSKRVSPHVHTVYEVDFSRILRSLPRSWWGMHDQQRNASFVLVPFVAWAACRAIRDYPILNSSVESNSIRYHSVVRLRIESFLLCSDATRVHTTIINAQDKDIADFEREIHRGLSEAQACDQEISDLEPPTFTIALSPDGGIVEMPLIRQPQVAILAMGALEQKPIVKDTDSDNLSVAYTMCLTLAHDHRIIDGAAGCNYMSELKHLLESWS